MTKLQILAKQARSLSMQDLAKLRALLEELHSDAWDAQIEKDARSGALDKLSQKAMDAYDKDECTPLEDGPPPS